MIKTALIIYIIYIWVFLLILFRLVKLKKNANLLNTPISYLATLKKPKSTIFNAAVSTFGLLSLILPYTLSTSFPFNYYVLIASALLSFVSIGTFLVGIFEVHVNYTKHIIVGAIVFLNVIFTGFFFSVSDRYISKSFIHLADFSFILSLITIVFLVVYLKSEKSFKYAPLEWVVFILTLIWNTYISIILISLL